MEEILQGKTEFSVSDISAFTNLSPRQIRYLVHSNNKIFVRDNRNRMMISKEVLKDVLTIYQGRRVKGKGFSGIRVPKMVTTAVVARVLKINPRTVRYHCERNNLEGTVYFKRMKHHGIRYYPIEAVQGFVGYHTYLKQVRSDCKKIKW